VATCGGVGRLGLAPGTAGAAVGAVLAAGLAAAGLPPVAEAGLLVGLNLLSVSICTRAARLLGRGSDPGAIVLDEAATLPLGLLVIPAVARTPVLIAVAFLLHRIFDISKLPPARQLERLPGGLGIMADDWAAAAWVAVCLVVARWLGMI
jgi:phosphatidylglycerophosphatase A